MSSCTKARLEGNLVVKNKHVFIQDALITRNTVILGMIVEKIVC